jgi:hypothetical protein
MKVTEGNRDRPVEAGPKISKRKLFLSTKANSQQLWSCVIIVKLRCGGTATLPSRDLYDMFRDVLEGRQTPWTRIALAAESSNENGRMIELMQALAD